MTSVKSVKTMEEDQSMLNVQAAARECLLRLEVGGALYGKAHRRGWAHAECSLSRLQMSMVGWDSRGSSFVWPQWSGPASIA